MQSSFCLVSKFWNHFIVAFFAQGGETAEERNTAYLWTRMNSLDSKLEESIITWRKLNDSSVLKNANSVFFTQK